jgi:hypothetical protein
MSKRQYHRDRAKSFLLNAPSRHIRNVTSEKFVICYIHRLILCLDLASTHKIEVV